VKTWNRSDVKVMQEFGNTLVALGLLKAFFCWANVVEDLEHGCACGFCRYTRTTYSISMWGLDGKYFEDEVNLHISNPLDNRPDIDSI
jgi:hypothetical protein